MPTASEVVTVPDYAAAFDRDAYAALYRRSVEEPDAFWAEHARCVDWRRPFTRVREIDIRPDAVSIRWFSDGLLNACHNCVDRHLEARGDQVAILWEGDEPGLIERITYS